MKSKQMCLQCVMDTTDPEIVFDDDGVCSHCHRAQSLMKIVESNIKNEPISELLNDVRSRGKGRRFDAIVGLSGGLDSSYVALKVAEHGLRVLALHVDGGWNTDESVSNVHSLVRATDMNLETAVIDWEEMSSLQIAFLRSGVMNQDIPQDHSFFATLYKVAARHRINTVITGSNFASESILPRSWGYDAMDGRHIRAIASQFGGSIGKTYPTLTLPRYYLEHVFLRGLRVIRPLNHLEYTREGAIAELQQHVDWRDYGGKHQESAFTHYFQHVYLLDRFGIDKRRAHLSSLIASGQMTRDQALTVIASRALNTREEENLVDFVARKLGLETAELRLLTQLAPISYQVYPNDEKRIERLARIGRSPIVRRLLRA